MPLKIAINYLMDRTVGNYCKTTDQNGTVSCPFSNTSENVFNKLICTKNES